MDTLLANLATYLSQHLAVVLRLAVIIVLAWLGIRLAILLQKRLEKHVSRQQMDPEDQARLITLGRAGAGIVNVVIIGAALMMSLHSLGINITPLLASAGVAGLALSLGAQTLIKDYLNGALILFENIYQVGELIEVNDILGTVEQIDLRATHLRDFSGKLYTIPNGEIRMLSNTSRDWRRAIVEINLSLDADLGRAISALQTATQQAAQGEDLKQILLEAPDVQGWNDLNEWSMQVRVVAKTKPGKQLDASGYLRKAILEALQAEGIELGVPVYKSLAGGSK